MLIYFPLTVLLERLEDNTLNNNNLDGWGKISKRILLAQDDIFCSVLITFDIIHHISTQVSLKNEKIQQNMKVSEGTKAGHKSKNGVHLSHKA